MKVNKEEIVYVFNTSPKTLKDDVFRVLGNQYIKLYINNITQSLYSRLNLKYKRIHYDG